MRTLGCAVFVVWLGTISAQLPSAPVPKCGELIDLTLLVDTSANLLDGNGFQNWNALRDFIFLIIDSLRMGPNFARVAMVTFGGTPAVIFDLEDCSKTLCMKGKINTIVPNGRANFRGGFDTVLQVFGSPTGNRKNSTDVIILITHDTPDKSDRDELINLAKAARSDDKIVIGVGVSEKADHELMRRLVTKPFYMNYFAAMNHTDLFKIVEVMKEAYCPGTLEGPQLDEEVSRDCRYDIVILTDKSGSIVGSPFFFQNWVYTRFFLIDFMERLASFPNTRFSFVTFATDQQIWFRLGQCHDSSCIRKAVYSPSIPDGETHMVSAFERVRTDVLRSPANRKDAQDLVIFLTDGFPNPSNQQRALDWTIQQIKGSGARIFGIGITDKVNEGTMRRIVSQPFSDNYFKVENYRDLAKDIYNILRKPCPTLKPTAPPELCIDGGDVVFVLDASGSIDEVNFNVVREFVASIIQDFPIESRGIRVAVETFADSYQLIFHLNKYKTRGDMIDAVRKIHYTRGSTNTAAALRYLRESMLTSRHGVQSGKKMVAVVITDGNSNNKRSTIEEAHRLKVMGVHVIVIQVGTWVDESELNAIASHPYQNNKIFVANFRQLRFMRDEIRDIICNNRGSRLSENCKNGGTGIDAADAFYCICPEGYRGKLCQHECREPADIIFAVDRSTSIHQENFQIQVDFLRNFVSELNFNMHRVGLVSFATDVKIHFQIDEHQKRQTVLDVLDVLFTGGTTNTASAFRTIRKRMFMSGKSRIVNGKSALRFVVLITDGRSDEEDKTWEEAKLLRRQGVFIIPIGVGRSPRQLELQGIASWPVEKNVLRVDTFQQLNNLTMSLLNSVCNNVDECETNECKNGGRCVDGINGKKCVCRPGFNGKTCDRGCSAAIDLVLLIDSSGSIRSERFPFVIQYMVDLVDDMTMGYGSYTRIAAVSWSDGAKVEFRLDQYMDKQDVIHALRRIKFVGSRTNTYQALEFARRQVFLASRGDRPNAPNFAIVFTDGGSNINSQLTIPEAVKLREKGVHVSIIAVGDDMNEYELQGIASVPVEFNIVRTRSYRGLPRLLRQTVSSTCDDVDECAAKPCLNGGECQDGLHMYMCLCRGEYVGVNCEMECRRRMDIAFILDISGSVDVVYDLVVNFTRRAVHALPFRYQRSKAGLITYSDRASLDFSLNKFKSKQGVLNALVIRKAGGRTNTQAALRLMHSEFFTYRRGDRPNVPNIAILLTDGKSNINPSYTTIEAERARKKGIEIHVIAVSDNKDMTEINAMASDPKADHVSELHHPNEINDALTQLISRLCR